MDYFKKTVCSLFFISIYILIGIATSKDEERADFSIWNSSGECTLKLMELSYVNGENETFEYGVDGEINPGDTLVTLQSMLDFRTFSYLCSCPGDSTHFDEIDISTLANRRDMGVLEVGCD